MTKPTAHSAADSGAGVLELLRLFRDDQAFADQYAAARLEQAKAVEPVLKAFEYLPQNTARRPGPLSGIPVAIKDIIATADMPTTNGSPIYRDHIPTADAWVVERLRSLGATIFGKTVSTEFAWRHPGPTVNPWNRKHTPGGSSSGSAAAVAAGIVPLALGTQTLGSVIRPAAFNGIVGLKPSFGAIPRTGVHPLSPSLDHVGFFARRVDDVAYALSLHPTVLAVIKVTSVVTGHIVAVIAAHDKALRLLPSGHQLTGQLTMMLVMVSYTFTGLYLLFSA